MRAIVAALLFSSLVAAAASGRTLEQVKASGTLVACLPANVLPYSRREGEPHGFQPEVANAIAKVLGVSVKPEWVIIRIQALHANCDVTLDVIADSGAQGDTHLTLSKPYYRSGVALVSRPERGLSAIADLSERTKVAVQAGSFAAMILGERHIGLSMYAFEDEMLQSVADGGADAAMVSPASAGYFNLQHPDHKLNIVLPKDADPRLGWNIGVGVRKPDPALRAALDDAIAKLVADGTMAKIYGRYGVTLPPPQ